jgi:hypothetical protein
MSTETKPLKLMPHVKRTAANGRVYIEPGDRSEFELPQEFISLFDLLGSGSSLSKLVDQVDPRKAGTRFRIIRKFLIFLDENDMLADRDYMRLAESLKPAYTWPTSILSTEFGEIELVKPSKRTRSIPLTYAMLFVTCGLALGSAAMISTAVAPQNDNVSAVRALVLFVLTMSLARSVQAAWAMLTTFVAGSVARVDLVMEIFALRLRQEQLGRPV